MTQEEFSKIIPGKTLVDVVTTEGTKSWMCCTEDLTNPYPMENREDDWYVYANNAEIIK